MSRNESGHADARSIIGQRPRLDGDLDCVIDQREAKIHAELRALYCSGRSEGDDLATLLRKCAGHLCRPTRERVWHVAGPAGVAGLSLIAAAYLSSPVFGAVALTLCAMGVYAALSTFWTLPTGFLTGTAAAGGIALINSIGNLGGFVGPYAVGWIKDVTGATTLGLVALAACLIMAGSVTLLLGHDSRIEMAESQALPKEQPVEASQST